MNLSLPGEQKFTEGEILYCTNKSHGAHKEAFQLLGVRRLKETIVLGKILYPTLDIPVFCFNDLKL